MILKYEGKLRPPRAGRPLLTVRAPAPYIEGMEKHPFVVYTASDQKYGDFLIDHWYRSLRENVDLSRTDVRVLDYGLSTAQRYYLEHEGASVIRCVKDGHVTVIRFRDLARDLRTQGYSQVMAVDGGDVVFQGDVAPLFELRPDRFRAVPEDLNSGFDLFLREEYFTRPTIAAIRRSTALRPQINAGLLVGPRDQFLALCDQVGWQVLDPTVFGPDQLVVNQVLNDRGYVPLPGWWNFVVATSRTQFIIEDGRFLTKEDHRVIPVVHNAGNWKFLRPIRDFGYGPGHNQVKAEVLSTLKFLHQSNDLFQTTRGRLRRFARSAWERALIP